MLSNHVAASRQCRRNKHVVVGMAAEPPAQRQRLRMHGLGRDPCQCPEGCVSENSFSRTSAVMAACSSMIGELITVWNRRLARPVKARRAVLRGQKMASTMTLVSKTTVMPGAGPNGGVR